VLGFIAVVFGAANVFGGFFVTDRMLEMFKKRETVTPKTEVQKKNA
jgi:NAD(P) transhydrogenase subunit alpha